MDLNFKVKSIKYLLSLIIIISLSGCQSEEDIKRAKEAEQYKQEQILKLKEELRLKEEKRIAEAKERERLEKEKNSSTLYQMGLSTDNGKVIFDTNMAKNFFTTLGDKLERASKEIIEENSSSTKKMGVEIEEHNISIDFNKTKVFLEHWSNKISSFAKEISSFGDKIEDNNLSK